MSHPSRKKITMSFSLILCTLLSFRTIWQSNQLQTSYSESDDEKYGSFLPVLMERNNDDKLLSQCCSGRRIVALSDFDDGSFWPVVKNTTISNHKPSKKLQYPMSRSSKKQNSSTTTWRAFEQHWFEDCEPIPDVTIHPTCNSMHELDFFDESPEISLLSMEGSWRSVWKVTAANNSNTSMILKVLQLDREFDAESNEIHALDSLVMERLTASPYVVSSFGHCGQSVLTEFAQSSGRNLLKDTKLSGRSRVRLARDLARGLAELHALQPLDFGSSSSKKSRQPQQRNNTKNHTTGMQQLLFAHHDINIANIISLAPKAIQWNDFNLGIMSRQDRTTAITTPSSSCPVPIRFASPMWRSPEEIANATGTLRTEGGSVQASDVYSLGNILFAILTTQQPWKHLEGDKKTDEDICHAKLQGQGPHLPTKFLTPPKAESHVLYEAMQACLRFEASQRPTAWQLAHGLGTAYKWFQQPKETLFEQPTSEAIRQLFAISTD